MALAQPDFSTVGSSPDLLNVKSKIEFRFLPQLLKFLCTLLATILQKSPSVICVTVFFHQFSRQSESKIDANSIFTMLFNCQSIKDVADKRRQNFVKKYSVSRNGLYKLFT